MKQLSMFLLVLALMVSCTMPGGTQKQKSDATLEQQLQDLTDQIVLSLSQQQKSKIAVIEFSNLEGNVTQLGRYLAEELITRLYRTGKFDVIERQMLNKVIQEHSLTLSGIIDENSARELGKILGVDAIASGSVTDLGSHVKVNARLISTETGKVFSVASVRIIKDAVVSKLMGSTITEEKPGQPAAARPQVVEEAGFRIELLKSTLSNRKAICELRITNTTENDKEFQVTYGWQYKTMIFDDMGNEHVIKAVKYADQLTEIKGLSQYDNASKKIVAGTTVAAELHFDQVSSQAQKIALLQILCGYRGFKVEFRDIDLIRK